ncbi:MAG: tyrosine-type recombinase/integrase [Kiritimatiellae bacterium]|nr:tyrosine-type recombinase/integrase [Kiritimatiellia bacterium]
MGYNMPAPNGNLYRRFDGHYLKADDPREGVWYLRYKIHGCRHAVCLGTTDRETAQHRAAEHLSRINRQDRDGYLRSLVALGKLAQAELDGRNPRDDALAPEKLWERYEASRRRPQSGEGTLSNYESQVKRFAAWIASRTRNVASVSPETAEQYVRHLEEEKRTPATVRAHVATLARVWRVLLPDARNPWTGLHPTETHQVNPYRRLSLQEVKQAAKAARKIGEEEHALIVLGYYTALRMTDAACLDAAAYDRKALTLTVTPEKTARRKPQPITIPVLPELAQVLPAATEGPLLPRLCAEQRTGHKSLSKRIAALIRETAGGDTAEGKASFHSLRATLVSLMDEAGAPQSVTDSITGHAPRSMHGRYAHPDTKAARTWMEKALPRIDTKGLK